MTTPFMKPDAGQRAQRALWQQLMRKVARTRLREMEAKGERVQNRPRAIILLPPENDGR